MVGADGGYGAGASGSSQNEGCLVVRSGLKGKYIECSTQGRTAGLIREDCELPDGGRAIS